MLCHRGLLLLLLFLLPATAVQARKFSHMTPQGKWVTIEEAQYKPRRSGTPLIVNANGITVNVNFDDPADTGFNDPVLGPLRREAVRAVFIEIASALDYPGGVLDVVFEPSGNEGFGYLASGGTNFPEPSSPPGFYNGFAFDHLNSRTDPSAVLPDLYCSVNFGYPIFAGPGNPSSGEYDLISLLLHEFVHGLGIVSLADQNGNSAISESNPGIFTVWDQFLVMGASYSNLWSTGGAFVGNPSSLVGSNPGVYFSGPLARAKLGRWPKLYTPDYFEMDSSLSHWIPGITDGAVMVPGLDMGYRLRNLTAFEKEALKDLGWKIWEVAPAKADRSWQLYR